MALVLADRVQETTTTTGTGTVTLAGAVSGFQSFSVVGNGNTTFYTIVDSSAGDWEVGLGTYTSSGTTLARTTVLASSNSGSLVNFGAGTKQVFVTYPASQYGNVVGPASASDSRIALYDGTTGRLLKNFTSGVAYLSSGSEAYVTAIGQITAKYAFTLDSADTAGWTLNSATAGNSVTFKPPSSGGNNTYIWPAGPGSSGYALTTNGTGTLSWTAVVAGPASATDNAFVRFDGTTGRLIQNSNYATLDDNGKATFADQVYIQSVGAGYAQIVFEKNTGGAGTLTLRPSTSQSGNVTLVFPTSAGSSGQALTTDGTGVLAWTTVGGGGGASTILESKQTISSNYTLTAGYNGISVGPVTISSGVSVTIPSGAKWLVVNSSPGATPVSGGGGIMPAMIWG